MAKLARSQEHQKPTTQQSWTQSPDRGSYLSRHTGINTVLGGTLKYPPTDTHPRMFFSHAAMHRTQAICRAQGRHETPPRKSYIRTPGSR